ncbi:MAG: glycosyltransferase [Gemmatimonadetes bacterium]|nr:glycosyltransferase [Gemmatimonadota bacterium]
MGPGGSAPRHREGGALRSARHPGAGVPALSPPRVSILLPVRDGERHLEACVASLRSQTLEDWEAVVVDDGSEDATPRLLAAWADADPRVVVIRQEAQGLVAALERARAAAQAPLVARMDADDVALPGRLQAQMALLESDASLAVVGCRVAYFPEARIRGGARRYESWLNDLVTPDDHVRDLFVECPLAHPTFLLRRDALEAAGGYRDRGWPEDYDLLLRLWRRGGRMAKVPEVLLRWREAEGRLSRTHPAYAPAAFRRCKVHHLRRSLLRDREGAVVWGAGPTGKAFARELAVAGVPVRAFVDLDPRKIGQEIHGAPVVAPADVDRFRGALALGAVGQACARAEIREALEASGWVEIEDFVMVA